MDNCKNCGNYYPGKIILVDKFKRCVVCGEAFQAKKEIELIKVKTDRELYP